MKKKKAFNPLVRLTTAELNAGGIGSDIGEGNAIGPVPMSFDEWNGSSFCGDVDGTGSVDFADYVSWWESNGFGADGWMAYNPDVVAAEDVPADVLDVVTDEMTDEVIDVVIDGLDDGLGD